MEYTNIFTPLICIFLSIVLGGMLGVLLTMYTTSKYCKNIEKELDKFRELYFDELNKWKNKYDNDDDYEAY